jgi:hypothetical protein
LLSYTDTFGVIKIFLLNNQNVSAEFLARFFLTTLRQKNPHYKSVVIPIRKDLGRQVFLKRRFLFIDEINNYRSKFLQYRKEYTYKTFSLFRQGLKKHFLNIYLFVKS